METEDGYLLQVNCIINPRIQGKKPSVFFQHGLLSSAESWLSNDAISLPFILARAGYDVWLGNARGSRLSRAHKSLDPDKDAEFWEFSF